MIPSNRWFPSSLQERAAWFANFSTQFAIVGAGLGFTPAEIDAVQDDGEVFQFLASMAVQLDAFRSAVQQYRSIITEENIGDPTPAFPANVTFALPKPIPSLSKARRQRKANPNRSHLYGRDRSAARHSAIGARPRAGSRRETGNLGAFNAGIGRRGEVCSR